MIYKSKCTIQRLICNIRWKVVTWFKEYPAQNKLSIKFGKLNIPGKICHKEDEEDNILSDLYKKILEIKKKLEFLSITLPVQILFYVINQDFAL